MKSFEAKIFVGFKEFTNIDRTEYILHTLEECEQICRTYCDEVGWCVTVTPTKYIYTNGSEDGAIIGIIQYPRFPDSKYTLKLRTYELAERLMIDLGQCRVTINFPKKVIMLTNSFKTY